MLTTEDKRELTERGRKAGLGLDLWPEVKEELWRKLCDTSFIAEPEVQARIRESAAVNKSLDQWARRFNEKYERDLLNAHNNSIKTPGPAWSPYFIAVDPASGHDYSTLGNPWGQSGSAAQQARVHLQEAARLRMEMGADLAWIEQHIPKPIWPRIKNLLRRMSPWYR